MDTVRSIYKNVHLCVRSVTFSCQYFKVGFDTLHGEDTVKCGLQKHRVIKSLLWAVVVLRQAGG